ncbi:hypothetical protein [Dawidia soli]|uniref:Lipoprotein n=1 Tax=Dawidia soli TaxID=2782352 RepID=A0AAP2GM42_9BACT|nr:hypothetical protein [Dawidia soli]MBT1690863.1 hypothetical protein [Dawidia soli]
MRIYVIIVLSVLLLSCSSNNPKNDNTVSANDSLQAGQSVSMPEEDTLVASAGTPKTTTLPLTAHYDADHMYELVRRASIAYKLPTLEKVNYIVTDSSYLPTCDDGASVSVVFNFKSYRYKLPVIANYQVYVVCDTTLSDYKRDKTLQQLCMAHVFYTHAYLLLYDSVSKQANAINIFNVRMGMHIARRTFDIDKNYNIHIQDYGLSSETEDAEEIPTLRQLIRLASNGDIVIETPAQVSEDEFTGKTISRKPARRTIFSPTGSLKSSTALEK